MSGQWHRVAALGAVKEDAALPADVEGEAIALYRVGDAVFALSDWCTHQPDVRLSGGYVEGSMVECPMHQSCFDVRTGAVLGPPADVDVRTFAVKVEEGSVYVSLEPVGDGL